MDRGCRLCPRCEACDGVDENSPLWPKDWRCNDCGFALQHSSDFVRLAPALDEVDDGFALDGFPQLAAIEDGHFWFTTRNTLITWLIRRHAPNAHRVLEIGCGTGFTMYALRDALPRATITASELHSRGLTYAHRRHRAGVEFVQMDARHVYLRSALDLIGAFDVLEHIADDHRVIEQINQALKPGGTLIATVPQHPWLWSSADDLAHHQRRYRRGELAAKLREHGLRVVYQTSFAALVLPLLAAVRLRDRQSQHDSRTREMAETEARPSPIVNAALTKVFMVEHTIRRIGMPLPFGGSQIVVATKATG
jgi:SAM-dependent methyltransferase